jgi:predicted dehydrogenase
MKTLRTLIVGCGNIAGRFDSGRKGSGEFPLTHAGAYARDGRFDPAACVDPDDGRRKAFMADWGIPLGFRSLDDAVRSPERFDVVSICSPTESHARDLELALTLKPRLFFCEKPVTDSLARTEALVRQCARSKTHLAVNYTRRWDPAISDLRQGIEQGRWGRLRSAVGYYNKGLLNNGSHMLDLLHLLVGPLSVVKVGRPFDDFSAADPTVPVWLEGPDRLPIQLACGHAADFAFFELQLIFSNAVVTMEEGGLFWRERAAADSSAFPGYRIPGEGIRRAGSYPRAMLQAIDNIFAAINHGRPLASTGESALATQRLCEQIRQS